MVIKCTLSIIPENIGHYARQSWGLPPLPGFITKMGPYVNEQAGGDNQIVTIFDFEKSRFREAWECISEQLDVFRIIPGVTLSVHIMEKGREVKGYRISWNQPSANPDAHSHLKSAIL